MRGPHDDHVQRALSPFSDEEIAIQKASATGPRSLTDLALELRPLTANPSVWTIVIVIVGLERPSWS